MLERRLVTNDRWAKDKVDTEKGKVLDYPIGSVSLPGNLAIPCHRCGTINVPGFASGPALSNALTR